MTTAIISVETLLLVVLIVLVAGLLRSHAEILRRLEGGELGAPRAPERVPGTPAPPLSGPTPEGDAVSLDFAAAAGAPTLLAFLTSGCSSCAGFWATLAEPRLPAGVQTVIVAHGAERERPAALRELAPDGVPVVMSSEAWRAYEIPGAPYFVLVDGSIRGEGAASTWAAVSSLVSDAIADERAGAPAGHAGSDRARTVDRTLSEAGIGPEHPSLYPAGREP